jgi:hypothetical protein
MLSSRLGRSHPTQSRRLSVCSTHFPWEQKPSYSKLPLRCREIPRPTLPSRSRIASLRLALCRPIGSFENEVANINALWDASFSHRILCAFGCNVTVADGVRQEAGATASCCPDASDASVKQRDVSLFGDWVATLDGYVNAQIQPQVSGYMIKQDYREGSRLTPGHFRQRSIKRRVSLHRRGRNLSWLRST